jgi:sugar (pentulose or hexulose) kinase
MEGICYELRWTLDEIRAAGVPVERLTMAGGAARSPLWPEIVAGITGLPVTVPEVTEAGCWGAALLAGSQVGLYPDIEEAAGRVGAAREVVVDERHRAIYEERYAQYRRVSESIPQTPFRT